LISPSAPKKRFFGAEFFAPGFVPAQGDRHFSQAGRYRLLAPLTAGLSKFILTFLTNVDHQTGSRARGAPLPSCLRKLRVPGGFLLVERGGFGARWLLHKKPQP
jgi:hypothetical protein